MKHWTERAPEDYVASVVINLTDQIEELFPESEELLQEMRERDVEPSLKELVKLVRSYGLKMSLVVYDDKDPANQRGPICPDIFRICWEKCGKPTTFFDLGETNGTDKTN